MNNKSNNKNFLDKHERVSNLIGLLVFASVLIIFPLFLAGTYVQELISAKKYEKKNGKPKQDVHEQSGYLWGFGKFYLVAWCVCVFFIMGGNISF